MDSPFIYDQAVSGKNFIGRRQDATILGNLLRNGEHVALYDIPRSGKSSLIQHTLFQLRMQGCNFTVGQLSVQGIRSVEAFVCRLCSTVLGCVGSSPMEYAELCTEFLADTHFVFDRAVFAEKDEIISLSWALDENDLRAALSLPQRLAAARNLPLILVIEEFQDLNFSEGSYRLLKIFEEVLAEGGHDCRFIFSGSSYNAMKELFETRGLFWRRVEKFRLSRVEEKEIVDHITKGFLSSGKVIGRELLSGVCQTFRCNLWYINQFAAICDAMSKGYIMEPVLLDALRCLISIHEPRFRAMMQGLTTHQVQLLRAILDGHKKFSTAEVVRRYDLHSSANVKRVKDALIKKEIVSFNEKEEPIVLDPLFEYWVRKEYFKLA